MKKRHSVLFIFVLALTLTVNAGAQTPAPGKTVWSGVYSAEQAERGAQPYKVRCARCHGEALEGTQGNGLVGKDFMERWREDTMASLFEFVSGSMPPARRGEGRPLISIPDYLDIVAYVLYKNQFPAGASPLTEEGMDDILIQYQDGPRPLPSGALVRIAGCLTGSGQDWAITAANDPVRTRTAQNSDYEEFKAAESAPPGNLKYQLFNIGFLGNAFKPENLKGAKLLVKGNLIRQTDSMRISVLAVRKVSDTCESQ